MIPSSSCPPSRQLDQPGLAGHHDSLAAVTPLAGTRSRAGEISKAQFLASYGSNDPDFVFGLISQLANINPKIRQLSVTGYQSEAPDVDYLRLALAIVRGMAPRDPLEAMTCAQMFAVHSISTLFGKRLADAIWYQDIECAEQCLSRLVSTHCALTAAFDRHRDVSGQRLAADGSVANGNVLPEREHDTDHAFEPYSLDGHFSLFGPITRIATRGIRNGFPVDGGLHFVRAAIRGMAPRDPLEEQSCNLMALTHSWAMMLANRLTHAEDHGDLMSTERSLNRVSRRFCALTDAFDRHRNAGDRKLARRQAFSAEDAKVIVNDVHDNGMKAAGKFNGHASA